MVQDKANYFERTTIKTTMRLSCYGKITTLYF